MRTTILYGILIFFVSLPLIGQIPQTITYQGVLTDGTGAAIGDGSYIMGFRLYASESGTTVLWSESQMVMVVNGAFNVLLGKETPLDLPFNQTYWLGVTVGDGSELSPRIQLTSSAYSFRARTVVDNAVHSACLADGAVTTGKIHDGAVTQAKLDPSLSLPPGGEAGGDLTGTYPNPTIAAGVVNTTKIADNSITSDKIIDGTIVDADVNSLAAIHASKLFGDAGIEFMTWGSQYYSVSANSSTVIQMGNMVLSAPTSGYIVVWLTGNVVFFADGKTLNVGINTTNSYISDDASVAIGRLDGSGTLRFYESFTAMGVFPVDAGNHTLYALVQGNTTFGNGNANVSPQTMTAIFIPKRY